MGLGPWRVVTDVSIHAPRCRGAMRLLIDSERVTVLFQSTPPVAEGRCAPTGKTCATVSGFNPRPPLPRGDARRRGRRAVRRSGFNPRPPLPRGDAAMPARSSPA